MEAAERFDEYTDAQDFRAEAHRRRVAAVEHRARILQLAVHVESYKAQNDQWRARMEARAW